MPLVEFDNISKTYDGERLAVRNLNLVIQKGEFLTLLGPSGSGKTTTLMMLAGFEAPTEGDIRLSGRSLSRIPPHRRNIGVVFQNYALFPHLSVAENVAFPLSVRHKPRAEIHRRVSEALALVQLEGLGLRRPLQLSGGQQQRVGLARALVFHPDLVLMDEPLGSLDKQLREQLQLEIKHIQRDLGITVVYVTHDQSEALTMSDRIAVFRDGAVQQLAPAPILYEQPMTAFVARFIGESNFLSGKIIKIEGERCVVETDSGARIFALAIRGAQGERTTLSIRPERVVLRPSEGQCENVVEARVEELIYHGDHTRVRIHVGDNSQFIVKIPNGLGENSLSAGDAVRVGWHMRDCRALEGG